jgi:hypothetical protein
MQSSMQDQQLKLKKFDDALCGLLSFMPRLAMAGKHL